MRIYDTMELLIGNTPLVRLGRLEAQLGLSVRLLAKVEGRNPGGSVKDRTALSMLRQAERGGLLHPGNLIIEPTSGNTGIGLAMMGALRGYKVVILMPDSMSPERKRLMEAYGAKVILTPGKLGMTGAIEAAYTMAATIPGSWIPDQFFNPANPLAHYETTGPEIWTATGGQVDVFVATVGTGGTITGTGRYLKEQNPRLQVVAVEPAESPVLSGGKPGPHGIQGIGAGFVPEVLDLKLCDRIVPVSTNAAKETTRLLAHTQGLVCGISSGAALRAALELAKEPAMDGKTMVVLLPDTGERYLTTILW